ncbi:uncharacterized protein LOC135248565 [Anguilla rostrata]|uniref:uncharacterized protein LOC135248565 n=1 Tax=Anguilla rostrata TaxID=7938 RepID=UPI0030D53B83
MLNLTLMALAPQFPVFEPSDFALWFQVNLVVLLASFNPGSLVVIPMNISCDSYHAILKGLDQSLASLPPELTQGIASSREILIQRVPKGCNEIPVVGECKETPVKEASICAEINSDLLSLDQASGNSSEMLCNFSISDYACSSTQLTAENLGTLLKCKLSSNLTYSLETWKLFFTKMSSALDEALDRYSLMTSTINSPFVPEVLDVIGEVKINNFTEEELQDVSFIKMWFDIKLKPFIPSVSKEFLSCLSTKNFSCETYQAVVRALSEQISSLDRKQERFVYTHFIHLFLSRNDTSDPSCLSSTDGSTDWLQKNFGNFTVFAPLEDLVRLNDNFSSFETLALLTPTQTADLTVISGALKNTDQINTVFDQLETEDPFRNIDEYLTQLSTRSELPEIKPAVRDIMMTRTFHIIKMKFPEFEGQDWMLWFHVKLILVLPSIKAEMLSIAISNISCTNYHIIVGGIGKVSENMESHRKREIAQVLVDHLKESAHQIREPACRENIQNDADFLQINLGPFSEDVTYSDLKDLNITGLEVLDTLSPEQKAVLILDPSSNALENETAVRIIFNSLLESPEEEELEELEEFYEAFVEATEEVNNFTSSLGFISDETHGQCYNNNTFNADVLGHVRCTV